MGRVLEPVTGPGSGPGASPWGLKAGLPSPWKASPRSRPCQGLLVALALASFGLPLLVLTTSSSGLAAWGPRQVSRATFGGPSTPAPLYGGSLGPAPDAVDPAADPSSGTSRRAFVSICENDAYLAGALVLGFSLKQHNSVQRILFHYNDGRLSKEGLELLQLAGWALRIIVKLEPFKPGFSPIWEFQYTKLRLWDMAAEFDSLVYLDCDSLVLGSLDAIFPIVELGRGLAKPSEPLSDAPYPWGMAAVEDVEPGRRRFTFNAGVMGIRPDPAVFADMLSRGPQMDYLPDQAEQAFLNAYYADKWIRLPAAFNLSPSLYVFDRSNWDDVLPAARVIHFAGAVAKPMNDRLRPGPGGYRVTAPPAQGASDLDRLWLDVWDDALIFLRTVHPPWQKTLPIHSRAFLGHGS